MTARNDTSEPYRGEVRAIDAASGDVRWRHEEDRWVQSSPEATADAVYALSNGNGEGTVFRLGPDDGTVAWTDQLGDEAVAALRVADGTVFTGTVDGTVAAYGTDGTQLWQTTFEKGVWTPPAVVDGTAYVVATWFNLDDGDQPVSVVAALDPADGETRWRTELPETQFGSPPVVASDTVFVSGLDSGLYAVDAADGERRWHADTEERVATPLVQDGTVYAATGAQLQARTAADGTVEWARSFTADSPSVTVGTADALYTVADGSLTAVDPDSGASRPLADTEGYPVAVAGGTIYVLDDDTLEAYGITERAPRLPVPTPTPTATPTVTPTATPTSKPTATPTPTATETAAASPGEPATGESTGTTRRTADETATGGSGPGFSLATAVGSLVGYGLLRRGTRQSGGEE
jgi:outer membrane protein assembly factor BamB